MTRVAVQSKQVMAEAEVNCLIRKADRFRFEVRNHGITKMRHRQWGKIGSLCLMRLQKCRVMPKGWLLSCQSNLKQVCRCVWWWGRVYPSRSQKYREEQYPCLHSEKHSLKSSESGVGFCRIMGEQGWRKWKKRQTYFVLHGFEVIQSHLSCNNEVHLRPGPHWNNMVKATRHSNCTCHNRIHLSYY